MKLERSCGILMHISSLPSRYGIGDLGHQAEKWVDFLDQTGVKYWQILPLNPTGLGNSPYQGLSSIAGNPLFIDLENLHELGLLDKKDFFRLPTFSKKRVDFEFVNKYKLRLFKKAFDNLRSSKNSSQKRAFSKFKKENAYWLNDFALFMAIREENNLLSWNDWPEPLKVREKHALEEFIRSHLSEIEFHKFLQFIFFKQWKNLRDYATQKDIAIIGDIPIFVGFESADVWTNPHLFQLNKDLRPTFVSGVPPDYFSKTGQLWGNPLFDWKKHKQENYRWWIERIKASLKTVDLIRIDHFRGFAGYYSIPASDKTAENGKWVKGPGKSFFDALIKELGDLPLIAEDLGVITPDVINLRDRYNLPGMRIFQFAFSGDENRNNLPHNYPLKCIAYTGTHDNNTIKGWFRNAPNYEKAICTNYLGGHVRKIALEMIRILWASKAILTISPMQDFLQLNSKARMNTPSTVSGNWEWRMNPDVIKPKLMNWIKVINSTYDRANTNKR